MNKVLRVFAKDLYQTSSWLHEPIAYSPVSNRDAHATAAV